MSTLINGSMALRFQPFNTPTQGPTDTCPSNSAQYDHGRPSHPQPYNANHGWNRPQPARPGNQWQHPQPSRPGNDWQPPQNDWQRPPQNGGYRPQPTRPGNNWQPPQNDWQRPQPTHPENNWQPPQNQWERPHNGGSYRPQFTDRPSTHDGQASYAATQYAAVHSEPAEDAYYG